MMEQRLYLKKEWSRIFQPSWIIKSCIKGAPQTTKTTKKSIPGDIIVPNKNKEREKSKKGEKTLYSNKQQIDWGLTSQHKARR